MQLISLGGPAVKIISKSTLVPGGELVIIYNPYSEVKGLPKLRKQTAHLVLASRRDKTYCDKSAIGAEAFVIDSPGEFEVKKILINGQAVEDDKAGTIIFRVDLENISLGLVAGLSKAVNGSLVEYLEGVDVLFVPIGGGDVLNAAQAMTVVNYLEPKLVIPIQYKSKKFPVQYESISGFIKEFGHKEGAITSKFRLQKKDLPASERKLILLE